MVNDGLTNIDSLFESRAVIPSTSSLRVVVGIFILRLLASTENSIGTDFTPKTSSIKLAATSKKPPTYSENISVSAAFWSLLAVSSR